MHAYNPADFGIRNGIDRAHRTAADQHCRRQSEFRRPVDRSRRCAAIRRSSRRTPSVGFADAIPSSSAASSANSSAIAAGSVPASFNFAECPRIPRRKRELLQRDARQPVEQHSAGSSRVFHPDELQMDGSISRFELGLRYDWNMTPEERYGRFIVFDPGVRLARATSGRKGTTFITRTTRTSSRASASPGIRSRTGRPRCGVRTLIGGPADDQRGDGTSANPPLSIPLTLRRHDPVRKRDRPGPGRRTGASDRRSRVRQRLPAVVESERAARSVPGRRAAMAGYFGSKGTNLILRRNINQPVNGVRPYPAVSGVEPQFCQAHRSAISLRSKAREIRVITLSGFRSSKRFARGLQINSHYTWSKSLDYNSLSTQGVVVQNSYNVRATAAFGFRRTPPLRRQRDL